MRKFAVNVLLILVLFCSFALYGGKLFAAAVEVSWNPNDANDGVVRYYVHWGTSSGQYSKSKETGLNTVTEIGSLQEGLTYYFAVTAENAAGTSEFSVPVSVNIPPKPYIVADSDGDGIPDSVEQSMGNDPYDPFDSFYDNDLDGVSNFSEYRLQTDMNDFLDYPEFDEYFINMIAQTGEAVSMSGILPKASLRVMPLSQQFPLPVDLLLEFNSDGIFYYNLLDASNLVQFKLKVSVTDNFVAVADSEAGNDIFIADASSGIELDIPEGATASDFEVGIGVSSSQIPPQALTENSDFIFDILPFNMTLKKEARISVPYTGSRPLVEIYDFTNQEWKRINGEAVIENQRAVFYTKTLGRFKISEKPQQNVLSDKETESSDGGGSSSGMCFISLSI